MNRKATEARELRRQAWNVEANRIEDKLWKFGLLGAHSAFMNSDCGLHAPGDKLPRLHWCLRGLAKTIGLLHDEAMKEEIRELRVALIGQPAESIGWWDGPWLWRQDHETVCLLLAAMQTERDFMAKWKAANPAEFHRFMSQEEHGEARP